MVVHNYDIEHHGGYPWQFVQGRTCYIRLRCNEVVCRISILYGDPFWFIEGGTKQPVLREQPMVCEQMFLGQRYYSIEIPLETHKLRYHFRLTLAGGTEVYLTEIGVTDPIPENQIRPFMVPYVFEREHYDAPRWAKDMVWYQIFPDRFARTNAKLATTEFIPTRENYFGGTLRGITEHIPYLKQLGVQGIYLNPIFYSNSNHRYDTIDYARLDPKLGTKQDLQTLSDELHSNGMKLMLDGVFNHCSWEHPFWQDVLINGEHSKYCDWFYIRNIKNLRDSRKEQFSAARLQELREFECFAFASDMPKWNTENEHVINYLVGQAEAWTRELRIDAWRLDVPDEVSTKFLREFKSCIRRCHEDIYVIGEIWQNASFWLSNALFDGVMDYPLYFLIRDFSMTGADSLETFAKRLTNWYLSTPEQVRHHQFAFLSNHDIPRLLTLCGGNEDRAKLACFLGALLGGNLSVYYGDERGMTGGEDPDNRRAVNWCSVNGSLLQYYSELLQLKKTVLRDVTIGKIQLKDGLYLSVRAEKTMLAVIPPLGERIVVKCGQSGHVIFGNAEPFCDAMTVQGFALIETEEEVSL